MSKFTDRSYLRSTQYQTSLNLSARARLHQDYSTNPYEWNRWVFDQLFFPSKCRILELGCGPAYLWQKNIGQIPPGWRISLSDLSSGMLVEAKDALCTENFFTYSVVDAQNIPFADNSFDAVIANHMLYHVPDIQCALAEIQRVLSPGGLLYAATNGKSHLVEIREWKMKFFPEESAPSWGTAVDKFGLENGKIQLQPWFSKITIQHFQDHLSVTAVEPIINYLKSWSEKDLPAVDEDRFRIYLGEILNSSGEIQISKETGLFVCTL